MGKKTERINQLEGELLAARTVLRFVAYHLSVELAEDEPQPHRVIAVQSRFTKAFPVPAKPVRADGPRGGMVAGDDDDEDDDDRDDIDTEIDRMQERGLVPSAATTTTAMAATASGPGLITRIATELGIDVANEASAEYALERILQAIEDIKNPGDVAGDVDGETAKGDTLVDAFRHGRTAEHEVRGDLRSAHEALARIASALQIPNWDPRNPEAGILERVQQWDGIKHMIRRRIERLADPDAVVLSSMDGKPTNVAVAQDLKWVLTQIIAPAPLARFLGKMPPAVVTSTVMEVAAAPAPSNGRLRPITGTDLTAVHHMFDSNAYLMTVLRATAVAPALRDDLIAFLNLVVLPALRRVG